MTMPPSTDRLFLINIKGMWPELRYQSDIVKIILAEYKASYAECWFTHSKQEFFLIWVPMEHVVEAVLGSHVPIFSLTPENFSDTFQTHRLYHTYPTGFEAEISKPESPWNYLNDITKRPKLSSVVPGE